MYRNSGRRPTSHSRGEALTVGETGLGAANFITEPDGSVQTAARNAVLKRDVQMGETLL